MPRTQDRWRYDRAYDARRLDEQITTRVPPGTRQQLNALAAAHGLTLGGLLRRLALDALHTTTGTDPANHRGDQP